MGRRFITDPQDDQRVKQSPIFNYKSKGLSIINIHQAKWSWLMVNEAENLTMVDQYWTVTNNWGITDSPTLHRWRLLIVLSKSWKGGNDASSIGKCKLGIVTTNFNGSCSMVTIAIHHKIWREPHICGTRGCIYISIIDSSNEYVMSLIIYKVDL